MDDCTLCKDMVSLNRKYLYLVRQLSQDHRAEMLTGIPSSTIERIEHLTLDELEEIAECMPIPCFRLNHTVFDVIVKLSREDRRAFIANVALSRK